MHLLNLTLAQFLAVFGSVAAMTIALYLLDRSRRRQVVATLRFWMAAEQPPVITRRRRIQQPWSLILQLLSIALLLLAIGQLRFGSRAGAPRDHVMVLDTSAWMAASAGGRTLMDEAKERARAYLRALPSRDRVMLVRADGLTTPATAFEPNRKKLEQAIQESTPGATALNLDQALAFARRIQTQEGRRAGEVVFVGTGHVGGQESTGAARPDVPNLRTLLVADDVANCGLRKLGTRRSSANPDVWEIYVAVRNYGNQPRTVTLALGYGPARGGAAVAVGARRLTLAPDQEIETTFEYRTRAAGLLEASLLPADDFPADDHAAIELPEEPVLPVTVYSADPDLLRPMLAASPRVSATFRPPSAYRPQDGSQLMILDRFRPPSPPQVDSIWIDPPAGASPIPVRSRVSKAAFERWHPADPLASGLRTRDFTLEAATVFECAPDDVRIGEVHDGPVIVARAGKPKIAALGFHPALSPMRYELATPLLFANILRWMDPGIFRRSELAGGSVGPVRLDLDPGVRPGDVRVLHESGDPVPFTLRGGSLHFFTGRPGTVRVLMGDREYVYSLTLPQLWDTRWVPPENARRGVPPGSGRGDASMELWYWLALAGAAGLVAEWFLYGRFSRSAARPAVLRQRSEKVGSAR
ncbi:MAG TPA: VWA domain-containing protein [Bryobacteraceae bacterium]|nr:VWA domain-containing protein [Bryobacteraceae bacterium]